MKDMFFIHIVNNGVLSISYFFIFLLVVVFLLFLHSSIACHKLIRINLKERKHEKLLRLNLKAQITFIQIS